MGRCRGGVGGGICDSLGCGVSFKLSPSAEGSWTETVLHIFTGFDDGSLPGPVVLDRAGIVFGTALVGGTYDAGIVYKITP